VGRLNCTGNAQSQAAEFIRGHSLVFQRGFHQITTTANCKHELEAPDRLPRRVAK
jgi:hypothetical protein